MKRLEKVCMGLSRAFSPDGDDDKDFIDRAVWKKRADSDSAMSVETY